MLVLNNWDLHIQGEFSVASHSPQVCNPWRLGRRIEAKKPKTFLLWKEFRASFFPPTGAKQNGSSGRRVEVKAFFMWGKGRNTLQVQDPKPRQNRGLYHGDKNRTTPPAPGPPQIDGRVLLPPGGRDRKVYSFVAHPIQKEAHRCCLRTGDQNQLGPQISLTPSNKKSVSREGTGIWKETPLWWGVQWLLKAEGRVETLRMVFQHCATTPI